MLEDGDRVSFTNAAAEQLWGYSSSLWTGRSVTSLFSPQIEYLQQKPENAITNDGIGTKMVALSAQGKPFAAQVRFDTVEIDGTSYRVLLAEAASSWPQGNANQAPSQTFDSLERFASGLALELNNVLTGVLGNIHLAMEESGRRGRLQPALLEAAHNASLRARELTKELLEFASGDEPETCSANLFQLVRENSLIALSGSRMKCDFDFDTEISAVILDPAQFGQVIHQLIRFASKSMNHSGILKLSAWNQLIEDEAESFYGELMYGNYVAFSLEIPVSLTENETQHLFEPYSLQSMQASGLSLAIARSIIKRHHGYLTAESIREGLRVKILLPASPEKPKDISDTLGSGVPDLSHARVLVVDDQQPVRLVLQRSLEGIGHRVTACENGEDAIEAYMEAMDHSDPFDLVFLDVNIPGGMGGGETCRCLLEIDPKATCVVISGNTCDQLMTHYEDFGFADYLSKPFEVDGLERMVQRLINEREVFNCLRLEEEEDEMDEPIALPFSDNIVEIDFTSPHRA